MIKFIMLIITCSFSVFIYAQGASQTHAIGFLVSFGIGFVLWLLLCLMTLYDQFSEGIDAKRLDTYEPFSNAWEIERTRQRKRTLQKFVLDRELNSAYKSFCKNNRIDTDIDSEKGC